MKCFLNHLLNTKSVCHLVGMYCRTKMFSVRVFACMCVHTKWDAYSVFGKMVFTYFSLIAVSFDTTILLLTDRVVVGLEQNCILDLYQCEIRICPRHLNHCYLNTATSFSVCYEEFAQLLLMLE